MEAREKLVAKQKHILRDHQRNITYLESKKEDNQQEGAERDISLLNGIAKEAAKTNNNKRKKKVMVTWQQMSCCFFRYSAFHKLTFVVSLEKQPDYGGTKGK